MKNEFKNKLYAVPSAAEPYRLDPARVWNRLEPVLRERGRLRKRRRRIDKGRKIVTFILLVFFAWASNHSGQSTNDRDALLANMTSKVRATNGNSNDANEVIKIKNSFKRRLKKAVKANRKLPVDQIMRVLPSQVALIKQKSFNEDSSVKTDLVGINVSEVRLGPCHPCSVNTVAINNLPVISTACFHPVNPMINPTDIDTKIYASVNLPVNDNLEWKVRVHKKWLVFRRRPSSIYDTPCNCADNEYVPLKKHTGSLFSSSLK